MNPLRIAVVTRSFWPQSGARPRHLARLTKGLAQRGHQVTVVARRRHEGWPTQFDFETVRVHRQPDRNGMFPLRNWRKSLRLWLRRQRDQFDVVLAYCDAELVLSTCRPIGRPVVLSTASDDRTTRFSSELNLWRQASRLIIESMADEAALEQALPDLAQAETTQLLLPCVPPVTLPAEEQRHAARATFFELSQPLGLPRPAPLAICFPTSFEPTALRPLLQAWQKILGRWSDARLWLVGRAEAKALLAEIGALGLEQRVQLPGGFDQVGQLYQAANLAIVAEQAAPDLLAIEPIAHGRPTILSTAHPLATTLTEAGVAKSCPGHDPLAWHATIDQLLSQPEATASLAQAAHTVAGEHFNWENYLDQIEEMLRVGNSR